MGLIRDRLKLLYPNMKVYGVYRDKDGRGYVVFAELDDRGKVIKKGKRFSMAFARAAMQAKLGRILESWEEVDHKDGDCTNDKFSNYQVLTKEQHNLKKRERI